ncbi:hypothetical protein Aca07nite_25050 [Actinoplanes capillaceus]|uniref:DUF1700 domain-containing protein n=2 Tax=Actinoplanes campanulatus TaxID=113559 RepID=A0ABQ3WGC1_9ACTN|nr:hypothetical protein Aca07nite_25050 [Actinoplanes capillaceus]
MLYAMTTAPATPDDALVLDYLAALWAASDDLPPETRDDLMGTVSGYIAMRRDLAGDPSQALGRLGPPEQLVAAVRRSGTPTHLRLPVPQPAIPAVLPGAGGSERVAVCLLIAGPLLLPLISQAAALLIATVSPRWTPPQKAVAWFLVTAPAVAALLLTAVAGAPLLSGLGFLAVYLATGTGSVAAGLALRAIDRPH